MQPEEIPNEQITPEKINQDWSYVIDHLVEIGQIKPPSLERRKALIDFFVSQANAGKDIRMIIENNNIGMINDALSEMYPGEQLLKS